MTGAERRFGQAATAWDNAYDRRDLGAHRVTSRLDAAVELAGPGPGAVLDVGAGGGRLLEALAARGWTVYGVDPDPEMVDLARARLPAASERLVVGRAEALPFEDRAFDIVTLFGVLEYAAVEATLAELARVLRPRGLALIGVHSCRSPAMVWQKGVVFPLARRVKRYLPVGRPVPPATTAVSLDDALRGLSGAGLAVEQVVSVGAEVVPDPLDRIAPQLAYRVTRRAERSQRLRRVFATQRLIVARKS
jgi:SAM-dependent methyltransferase